MRHLRTGFTLIELMIVVALIGIVMAAGIVAFTGAQRNSRDARRRADVDALSKALEQYYTNNNQYYGSGSGSDNAAWVSGFQVTNLGSYFPSGRLPLDPMNTAPYYYYIYGLVANNPTNPDPNTRYCVSARLERATGNCSGRSTSLSSTNAGFGYCPFITTNDGDFYCAESRQ
ncbi:prepilin-type N-terminal cleavage/methylation domain-containing protein [Patescibacteria group bacterium]|nr:prepilin-type N-terminal cleavage/methylation domain-containing protein [Patescibacteria group bacterium]